MANLLNLTYKYRSAPLSEEDREKYGSRLSPYVAPAQLRDAVNLALQLERPLLIKGEPGSGKTRLAQAVAYDLELYPHAFEFWPIKSTSRAQDGLYTYDTVGRLRDAQLESAGKLPPEVKLQIDNDPYYYVRWGPLGNAFRKSQGKQRCILLIDEIDKADIDFPNDLLLELEEKYFIIDELRNTGYERVQADNAPIIFITSNDEKDLPDAFLRRCLFYYIKFPQKGDLYNIVRAHLDQPPHELIKRILKRFLQLRTEMEKGSVGKKVSTSELLDWLRLIRHYYDEDKEGVLQQLERGLLYPGVLLKSWEDYQNYPDILSQMPLPDDDDDDKKDAQDHPEEAAPKKP